MKFLMCEWRGRKTGGSSDPLTYLRVQAGTADVVVCVVRVMLRCALLLTVLGQYKIGGGDGDGEAVGGGKARL